MVLEWMSQYKHRTSRHLSVETNVITHDNGAITTNFHWFRTWETFNKV